MGKHYAHLTVDERNAIHCCLNQGLSQREIRRNAVGRRYDAGRAEQAVQARCPPREPQAASRYALVYRGLRPDEPGLGLRSRLRATIRMHPDEPPWQVSHKTIYCARYARSLRKKTGRTASLRKAHQRRSSRTWRDRSTRHPAQHDLDPWPSIEVAARQVPALGGRPDLERR